MGGLKGSMCTHSQTILVLLRNFLINGQYKKSEYVNLDYTGSAEIL